MNGSETREGSRAPDLGGHGRDSNREGVPAWQTVSQNANGNPAAAVEGAAFSREVHGWLVHLRILL